MQNSRSKFFVRYVLLLIFCLAAGFSAHAIQPKVKQEDPVKRISKIAVASHTDVPFVSNDVPQLSRANSNDTSKIGCDLLLILCIVTFNNIRLKLNAIASAFKYLVPFKTLFPQHAFS